MVIPDPRSVAYWVWAQHRLNQSKKRRQDAFYQDYDARTGRHSISTPDGQKPADLILSTAGQAAGNPIDLTGRIGDAQPKRKPQRRREEVQGEDPRVFYAAIVVKRYGATVSTIWGNFTNTQVFVVGSNFSPIRITNEQLVETIPFSSRPLPNVGIYLQSATVTIDEGGVVHLDFMLADDEAGLWVYPQHFVLQGNTIVRVEQSNTWRSPAVENIVVSNGTNKVMRGNPFYLLDERVLEGLNAPMARKTTIHRGSNRLFRLFADEIREYKLDIPYIYESIAEQIPEFEPTDGSTIRGYFLQTITNPTYDGGFLGIDGGTQSIQWKTIRNFIDGLKEKVLDSAGTATGNYISAKIAGVATDGRLYLTFDRGGIGNPLPLLVIPWGYRAESVPLTRPFTDAASLAALVDPISVPFSGNVTATPATTSYLVPAESGVIL